MKKTTDISVFRMTSGRTTFFKILADAFPNKVVFTRDEIKSATGSVPLWLNNGKYNFKETLNGVVQYNVSTVIPVTPTMVTNVTPLKAKKSEVMDTPIPDRLSNYVPFGHFSDLKQIVSSKLFFPVFITGLSGNGKTMMVDQVCARLRRSMIRVNITIETDEDDLIGGHTLSDGNIEFREGPVLRAMRTGSILLLDEVDLGSNKLMCLQSILEGKGYFIKKTGDYVKPANGFNIIATANTKGQGSIDGKFIGTQILNEAMLERFAVSLQQEYPTPAHERKILSKEMALTGSVDTKFISKLVDWADVIRKTYFDGGIDDVISTRRLVHIINAFRMFNDKMKSIEMCVTRFDDETKNAILDLYSKVDSEVVFEYNDRDQNTNEETV